MNYYEVGLGVAKHWKSAVYTYSSDEPLDIGTIVVIPFGKQRKNGTVLKEVRKPSFALKSIHKSLEIKLEKTHMQFMKWFADYYGAQDSQAYSQFMPNYLKPVKKAKAPEDDTKKFEALPGLNFNQKLAMDKIKSTQKPSVLHGVTGAGKTRIYTHLLLEQVNSGKDALLLYPEISLTSQIVNELQKYAKVIVFHSGLTDSERSRLWHLLATKSEPCIIVGPRSALFLPFKNLGIVIIDEAHESSYKQDSDIKYNSIYTAGGLCAVYGAKLLLGSATPPLSETEHILSRGGNLVCLHEKAIEQNTDGNNTLKDIKVVDAKARDSFSKHSMLSNDLIDTVSSALAKNEQAMLFINRRGTAKLVLCSTCDWQADCEQCDLPLTYHHDSHKLLCHTCGRKSDMPNVCPKCGSTTNLKSLGSKAIVDDIARLFPSAKIGRFDSDTSEAESFNVNYDDIRSGKIDILIGTQQLIKGLDLPKLSTVGILNADLSLYFPDFSSDERTFQLIAQALGRVGRGHQSGKIVVQTFQPKNKVINLALHEDWHGFRDSELQNRKEHSFPPYSFYSKMIFRDKLISKANEKALVCKNQNKTPDVHVDGPLPSFYFKRGGYYYSQLILRSKSRNNLLKSVKNSSVDAIVDLDPTTLL